MTNQSLRRNIQRGFTLVEMAIVLAVIGLILGAIAIAKDVQRNAEYQKVANKFVYQWKTAYDEYYQRTGAVIGDCQQSPTYMVNGSETTFAGGGAGTVCTRAGGAAVAGIPGNFGSTGFKICNGQGYAAGQVGISDTTLAVQNLRTLVTQAGIRQPPGRGEGHEDRFVYQDSNGNISEIQVCFQFNPAGTTSGAGNVMVIRGLTPDLARFIDQLIDGKADSREGRFRIQGRVPHVAGLGIANQPGTQWEANNTIGGFNTGNVMNATDGTGTGAANPAGATANGRQMDEDRVVMLTAHWSMDQ